MTMLSPQSVRAGSGRYPRSAGQTGRDPSWWACLQRRLLEWADGPSTCAVRDLGYVLVMGRKPLMSPEIP